jgi:hypothetical protein
MWLPHWDVTVTSRDIIFNEDIPRGDIDFSTDEYWLEIRKARRDETKRNRESVDDFIYLEGVVFYDDDKSAFFRVTRVTEHIGRYIVAHVMRYNPQGTENEQDFRESGRPYHVLDVERMLTGFVNEDDIAEPMLIMNIEFPESFYRDQEVFMNSVHLGDIQSTNFDDGWKETMSPIYAHPGTLLRNHGEGIIGSVCLSSTQRTIHDCGWGETMTPTEAHQGTLPRNHELVSGMSLSLCPFIPGLAPSDRSCPTGRDRHCEVKVDPRNRKEEDALAVYTNRSLSRDITTESCGDASYDELVEILNLPQSAQEPLDYAMAITLSTISASEPRSYAEAIKSPEKERWQEAIAIEIENLKKRGVLIEVPRPEYKIEMVDTKYVFKKKEKHGVVYKYKARLVARGFSQKETINYNEVFSSVARQNSLRIFLKISVDRGHSRRSIDFEAAFLFSPLETEELYLATPDGWSVTEGNVLQLKRSLYGLKQASRYWNIMITDFLISIGFSRCNSEPCLFVKDEGREMILLYVDDAIISCEKEDRIHEIITEIKKVFELGEEGALDWYIGSSIEDGGDTLFMNQKDYITKMLTTYGYDMSKTNETPLKEKFSILRDPEDALFHDFKIREKVGSLMFAAVSVRPDIAFAVSYVARFTTHPSTEVCRAVNHIFGYLAGTLELGINFVKELDSQVIVYCDSDYGSDINDYKSTSGVLVYIGSTVVAWYSSKQTTVAQSSTDAEILAMNFAAKEIVWLRGLLNEMYCPQELPTVLRGDSQSAILLSRNPVFHKRTKHVMIKFMYLVECLRESTIINEFVAGIKNWADMLTKSQKKAFFLACRTALNMVRTRAAVRETLSIQESS